MCNLQYQTLIGHDVSDCLWAKISTDLLDQQSYMVTVYYFSSFFKIWAVRLKATTVINKLKAHMARFGIPDEIVSDSVVPSTIVERLKPSSKSMGSST